MKNSLFTLFLSTIFFLAGCSHHAESWTESEQVVYPPSQIPVPYDFGQQFVGFHRAGAAFSGDGWQPVLAAPERVVWRTAEEVFPKVKPVPKVSYGAPVTVRKKPAEKNGHKIHKKVFRKKTEKMCQCN